MTEFILSVALVANGATTINLIHSLLCDSYGCVNHACGAIDPPSRAEYISCTMCTRRFQSRVWRLLYCKLHRLSFHLDHAISKVSRLSEQRRICKWACWRFITDKILSILPFPKPCVYTWGINVERVGIDDRRIATGVLYERMKHMARLYLSDMRTFALGFQHTARQQESADRLCGKDGTTGIIGTDDEPYKT